MPAKQCRRGDDGAGRRIGPLSPGDEMATQKVQKRPGGKKVFIVDDHPIVRERVAELINQEADLQVCGEAEDAVQAVKAIGAAVPDIAIVDITLKDTYGIELIKQLKELHPKLPILVLSMHDESLYGERALRAGAKGYLTKQEATKNIIDAIRRILRGEIYVSDKLAGSLVRKVAGGSSEGGGSPVDVLTDRELEVFQLLGQGLTVREVAERLFVSTKTVEAHREHIKQKLNFKTSSELLRFAIQYTLQEK
jgi:DNA-binding NarL/FixJ family response regulator